MSGTVSYLTSPVSVLLVAAVFFVVPGPAAAASNAALFRLFLTDGSAVVSYGEFARVDNQVVLSMPVGGPSDSPRLHVVTLPSAIVDWERTDRYTASVRYQHYATTRGEADFTQLSTDVAGLLSEIALSSDRRRVLSVAEQARQTLADWPRTHFGYRQQDVAEIVALLDEAISDLRASLGINSFDLSLRATVPPVELEPMLGMPSLREQVDQVIHVVAVLERSVDRVALMQVGLVLLDEVGGLIRPVDADARRRLLQQQIRSELDVDAAYARLSRRLLERAARSAARAETTDVERILSQILEEDERLGRRRPDVVQALHVAVQKELDDSRRLRLMRDRWAVIRPLFRDYERTVRSPLTLLAKAQPSLESIRLLAGPTPRTLVDQLRKLEGGADRLQRLPIPTDLRGPHDLFVSAWQLAEKAVRTRHAAIASGSVARAWEASSAAAAAMLLFSRAQEELRALVEPPRLK
jgi:hypothetical protein